MRRIKETVDNTSNRGEFNRAYKSYLEKIGKIHYKKKWYGTTLSFKDTIRYPSWKLVSKNHKQWMEKENLYIFNEIYRGNEYTTIKFKR